MQLTKKERATIRAWLEERIEFNTHPLDVQRIVEIGKLMKELADEGFTEDTDYEVEE